MSYAEQPARTVASKYGERRYHGPKLRVVLVGSDTVTSSCSVEVAAMLVAGCPEEVSRKAASAASSSCETSADSTLTRLGEPQIPTRVNWLTRGRGERSPRGQNVRPPGPRSAGRSRCVNPRRPPT